MYFYVKVPVFHHDIVCVHNTKAHICTCKFMLSASVRTLFGLCSDSKSKYKFPHANGMPPTIKHFYCAPCTKRRCEEWLRSGGLPYFPNVIDGIILHLAHAYSSFFVLHSSLKEHSSFFTHLAQAHSSFLILNSSFCASRSSFGASTYHAICFELQPALVDVALSSVDAAFSTRRCRI